MGPLDTSLLTAVGEDTSYTRIADGGATAATTAGTIDASLAAYSSTVDQVRWVLLNIGANDANDGVTEANWKTNYGYILDAIHAKWPNALLYVMRPWTRGYDAVCDDFAAWIGDLVTARAGWAFLGPDERDFLENGDDGVTYTVDGTHPTTAGYALTAAQWQAVMGY
jgi:lysophospholipase L1-like esterase